MTDPTSLPSPGELLPHRGAAMLMRAIVELEADRITCTGTITEGSPFAVGPTAPSFVAVELAAQAAALLELGGQARQGVRTTARSGYLVRVRRASFARAVVNVGRPLTVRVRRIGAAPPLFSYEAEVSVDGEPVFSGQISTYANPS